MQFHGRTIKTSLSTLLWWSTFTFKWVYQLADPIVPLLLHPAPLYRLLWLMDCFQPVSSPPPHQPAIGSMRNRPLCSETISDGLVPACKHFLGRNGHWKGAAPIIQSCGTPSKGPSSVSSNFALVTIPDFEQDLNYQLPKHVFLWGSLRIWSVLLLHYRWILIPLHVLDSRGNQNSLST